MTIYTIPSTIKKPESTVLTLVSNSTRFGNPLINTFITSTRPGTIWRMQVDWGVLTTRQEGEITAFFQSLNGFQHRVRMFDYSRENGPDGDASGTGRVNGSSQTGNTLTTDGWPVATTIFYPGDWISFNGELKRISAEITTNGSGQATLSFNPVIRESPADNEIIDYTATTAVFSLEDPLVAYGVDKALFSNFSVALIEDTVLS